MNEEKAREILGDAIRSDNSLSSIRYMAWSPGDKDVTLDDVFELEELEAIVWWMRNKGDQK